jgi:hypothetical protein
LILYFEIEKNSNRLGLLERNGDRAPILVNDKAELQADHLYYIFFREKPLVSETGGPSRGLSPSGEETKKVYIDIFS